MKKILSLFLVISMFQSNVFTQEIFASTDEYVTRESFVVNTVNTLELDTAVGPQFEDTTTLESWDEFLIFKHNGYMVGYENKANPEQKITKMEVAVMLNRIINNNNSQNNLIISDLEKAQPWAIEDIKNVVNLGYMSLNENQEFHPTDFVTEKELKEILNKVADDRLYVDKNETIMEIKSFDDYTLKGKLVTPKDESKIEALVIHVNSSGPHTYEEKVFADGYGSFNYVDFMSDKMVNEKVAFFSYNTRGVHMIEEAPFYKINYEEYDKYLPSVQIQDIEIMMNELKKDERLKDAKVYLFGISEASSIIPYAIVERNLKVDGLLLSGYYGNSLNEVLEYQLGGKSSMLLIRTSYGLEADEPVTKEVLETSQYLFEMFFSGLTFEEADVDGDLVITEADIKSKNAEMLKYMYEAIENDDNKGLEENYPLYLTSYWWKEHFELYNIENMLQVEDIPIHIVQGEIDFNCDVDDVYETARLFEEKGKTNLTYEIIPNAEHTLNINEFIINGTTPEGYEALFSKLDQWVN